MYCIIHREKQQQLNLNFNLTPSSLYFSVLLNAYSTYLVKRGIEIKSSKSEFNLLLLLFFFGGWKAKNKPYLKKK